MNIHFPPVSSGFRFHTHAFRSLHRVSYASPTVQDTPSRNAELSSAKHHVRDVSGTRPGITDMRVSRKSRAGSHLLRRMRHPLATKEAEKFGKVEYCGSIISYDLLHTKGETCAKFGGNRFRNVDLYKVQTQKADKNEQKAISALYIRLKIIVLK